MGKKGTKNAKKVKLPKTFTTTGSDSGTAESKVRETLLELTFEPAKLVARSPFNCFYKLADTAVLLSRDKVEFFVSRSLLSFASPYFRETFHSLDESSDEKNRPDCEKPPANEWGLIGCPTNVITNETSAVLDAVLRFVYPIPDPVFKEPVDKQSETELPFKLMRPIYDVAQKYEMPYVCQKIIDIANGFIYIKSLPEPGLTALRAYGVACRLNLDYDAKLKAARNAICITYKSYPTAGLVGEGLDPADIERFDKFHKRTFQACQNLLSINEDDAYPNGLSDVYANFVACSYCCGFSSSGNVMRCGAARWWQLYVSSALEKLRRAPLDPSIFFENFLVPVFREAQKCHVCAGLVHWKWCNVMPMLAHAIPASIYEVYLDDEDDEKVSVKEEETEEETELWC